MSNAKEVLNDLRADGWDDMGDHIEWDASIHTGYGHYRLPVVVTARHHQGIVVDIEDVDGYHRGRRVYPCSVSALEILENLAEDLG